MIIKRTIKIMENVIFSTDNKPNEETLINYTGNKNTINIKNVPPYGKHVRLTNDKFITLIKSNKSKLINTNNTFITVNNNLTKSELIEIFQYIKEDNFVRGIFSLNNKISSTCNIMNNDTLIKFTETAGDIVRVMYIYILLKKKIRVFNKYNFQQMGEVVYLENVTELLT